MIHSKYFVNTIIIKYSEYVFKTIFFIKYYYVENNFSNDYSDLDLTINKIQFGKATSQMISS